MEVLRRVLPQQDTMQQQMMSCRAEVYLWCTALYGTCCINTNILYQTSSISVRNIEKHVRSRTDHEACVKDCQNGTAASYAEHKKAKDPELVARPHSY